MDCIVPHGCAAGDEIVVDVGDGRELIVIVPDGLVSGDAMEIIVPPQTSEPSSPKSQTKSQCQPLSSTPQSEVKTSCKTTQPRERVLPPELSDDSSDDDDQGAKFGVGQPVEVLRTDGQWTLATVTDYDEHGLTYTVGLADGRLKHFVEESDLRIPRFLLLSTGNI